MTDGCLVVSMYLCDGHIFSQFCQLQVSLYTEVGGEGKGCDEPYKTSRVCHVSCFLPGPEEPAGNPPNETLQLLQGATKKAQHLSCMLQALLSVSGRAGVNQNLSPETCAVTCSGCELDAARSSPSCV